MQQQSRELQQAQLQLQQQSVKPGSYRSEAGYGGQSGYAGQAGGEALAYSLNKNASTGGITSEEEKNHVIRVLEHESKVYRLEKNIASIIGGGGQDFDVYSEQGRSPHQQRNARGYDV